MKYIRLFMVMTAAVAAIVATSGFAPAARAAAPRTPDVQRVNWGDVTIPGKLCKVNGSITLHNYSAGVRSGYGPIEVFASTVTHGNLGHGLQVTTLQVFCSAMSGTAAGQVAEGVFVFSSPGGAPHLLGTLTSQYHPKSKSHLPYLAVQKISTGKIATIEYWYASGNADCCPAGRAYTTWTWTGHKFVPGHTTVTG